MLTLRLHSFLQFKPATQALHWLSKVRGAVMVNSFLLDQLQAALDGPRNFERNVQLGSSGAIFTIRVDHQHEAAAVVASLARRRRIAAARQVLA